MAFLGIRRGTAPRLAPELDDADLGVVRRKLAESTGGLTHDFSIALVERLLAETRQDPDLRGHRFVVLGESVPHALPRRWRAQQPKNPDALLLSVWSAVSEAHQTGRVEEPDALSDACARAAAANPADAAPWVALLALKRVLREPVAELSRVWREIGRRDPWNREAHLQLIGYLSPQECGDRAQVLDFVETVRNAAPPGSPVAGLELTALVDLFQDNLAKGGVAELGATRLWQWPNSAAALDRAVADWTRPGFLSHAAAKADLNTLAYALVQADRAAQAQPVFQALGGCVTAWPWAWSGAAPVDEFEAAAKSSSTAVS